MIARIGSERKPYYLHSEILLDRCPFDRARQSYREARGVSDDNIWEEATDIDVFDRFVDYLYTSTYAAPTGVSLAAQCELHCRAYIFAEYLLMEDLKAYALKAIEALLRFDMWGQPVYSTDELVQLLSLIYGGTSSQGPGSEAEYEDGQQRGQAEEDAPDSALADESPPHATAEEETEHQLKPCEPDPLRAQIARFAAAHLEALRRNKAFWEVVVNHVEIAMDILRHARSASSD